MAASRELTVGFPVTGPRVPFLVAAKRFCKSVVLGADGVLLPPTSARNVLPKLMNRLHGFGTAATYPWVLFGGSNDHEEGYALSKHGLANGAFVFAPAVSEWMNETNTDIVCAFKAPVPCPRTYAYVNYEAATASGMPACIRVAGYASSVASATAICAADEGASPTLGVSPHLWPHVNPYVSPTTRTWSPITLQDEEFRWPDGSRVLQTIAVTGPAGVGVRDMAQPVVVWSPAAGLEVVDARTESGLGTDMEFLVVCQILIPLRILPQSLLPRLVSRGLLVGYLHSYSDTRPRYICPVQFTSQSGLVACKQMGYTSGIVIDDALNRNVLDMTLCVGVDCYGTEVALDQCGTTLSLHPSFPCCQREQAVSVECSILYGHVFSIYG